MIPTNLYKGHQTRHPLKIIDREIGVTSRLDLCQSLVDLRAEFLLEITVIGQLPKPKGQLEDS